MNSFYYKQVTCYDACLATCLAGCVSNVWVSPAAQHTIAHVVALLTLMQPLVAYNGVRYHAGRCVRCTHVQTNAQHLESWYQWLAGTWRL